MQSLQESDPNRSDSVPISVSSSFVEEYEYEQEIYNITDTELDGL